MEAELNSLEYECDYAFWTRIKRYQGLGGKVLELDVAIGRWWIAATSTFEHVFTNLDQLVMGGNLRELLSFHSMCLHRVYGQAHN